MRYFATYWIDQQPLVIGNIRDKRYEGFHETRCFEFSVARVDVDKTVNVEHCLAAVEVTLVAEKFPESSLHGPASLLKNRTLIYPCCQFKCRLGCACQLCRKKIYICLKAPNKETCDEDCADCRADCYDHMLFHRALHLSCKFCSSLLDHIPHYSFVVERVAGNLPDLYRERISASLFEHQYWDRKPVQREASDKFECDKCDGSFTRKQDLKRHEISVHYGKKYGCDQCTLKFTRVDSLEEHVRNFHLKEGASELQCDICKEIFKKKANLVRHAKVYSVCEVCCAVFCTTKQLQSHRRTSHLEPHSCDACKKSFSNSSSLKRHIQGRHRKDGSWKNFCEICNCGFCSFQDLLKHNRNHHPKECEYCGKSFSTNRNLSVHLTNREDILCSKCGILLCNYSELKTHTNDVHNIKQCDLCLKNYDLENYKYHMYAEHQQLVENE